MQVHALPLLAVARREQEHANDDQHADERDPNDDANLCGAKLVVVRGRRRGLLGLDGAIHSTAGTAGTWVRQGANAEQRAGSAAHAHHVHAHHAHAHKAVKAYM